MKCPSCGSGDFRPSRLRGEDIPLLLGLQYPVRCRTCRERMYVCILNLWVIYREKRRRRAEARALRSRGSKDSAGA